MKRREDLTTPRKRRRIGIHYDPDAFGAFSEAIARFIGTARFLVFQTVFIALWVMWNKVAPGSWRFDIYPFQFLTLVLSLQAAYAAPLILLAQNRQEERDRQGLHQDRTFNARTQADTEFLARELASVRLSLSDMVTTEDLRDHMAELRELVEQLSRPAEQPPARAARNRRAG